jgi:hypothetical protein
MEGELLIVNGRPLPSAGEVRCPSKGVVFEGGVDRWSVHHALDVGGVPARHTGRWRHLGRCSVEERGHRLGGPPGKRRLCMPVGRRVDWAEIDERNSFGI